MPSPSGGPSTDIVDLWKNSEELVRITHPNPIIPQSETSNRISSERSAIWTNLSQLSPSDQAVIMSRLAITWPYATERRAMNWPVHAGLLTNCVSAAVICTRINADMVLYNAKTPFLDAVKKAPKAPFVFGIYSSGITFFILHQVLMNPSLFGEARPCESCLASRSVAIALASGIAVPLLSTPYLVYYILLQRQNERYPPLKNALEVLTLCIEGSKAARPLLPALFSLQVIVSVAATYSALWGRKRLFGTLDSDSDLARELLTRAQTRRGLKEKMGEWLRAVPFFGGIVSETPPEQERIQTK